MKVLRKVILVIAGFSVLTSLTSPAAGAATPAPAWSIQSLALPTNFPLAESDESGQQPRYRIFFTNSGSEETDGTPIQIVDTLPEGLAVEEASISFGGRRVTVCTVATHGSGDTATDMVTCEVTNTLSPDEPARLAPDRDLSLEIRVETPTSPGPLLNRVEVKGGGAEAVEAKAENNASEEPAHAGLEEFHAELTGSDGKPARGAASHPFEYTTSFAVNMVPTPPGSAADFVPAEGDLKQIEVTLPPGLSGNPSSVPRCTAQQFATEQCPASSQVGLIHVEGLDGGGDFGLTPIYNLVPPLGMPAQFVFPIFDTPNYINTKVRSDSDYGITAYLSSITETRRVTAARTTFWGTPWDESHDRVRDACLASGALCPVEGEGPTRPFMRLPSSCANPLTTTMGFTTWARPVTGASQSFTEPAPLECEKPPFDPTIEARPTTSVADAPSGLHVDVHIPQLENEDPEGLAEADLEDTTVTLPEGFVVNPSSADGLSACSEAQIGYRGFEEGHPSFSADPAECPDAAKIGSVELKTPLVDHPLPGAVYLAMPHENPFDSLLAIYIAISDPQTGVVVKLPGKVIPDPATGRLTTTVEQSPQQPFEDFELDFFEGARAPLRTPPVCGTHTTTATFTPWTAPEGSSAFPTSSFETTTPAAGQGSCPATASGLPGSSSFEAGTESPVAGTFSPLLVNLARGDGTQEFSRLTLNPPPGLLARLAGIPYCPDSSLAAAASRSGRSEEASPSCPAASHVGTATVGAGAGPAPYHVSGNAYLAGPYEGAPLSLAVVTPAVAGPFDLGTVVVRTALHVDPATAQITATTDPIPHILQGIPLDVRSIAVKLDHSGWGLNPTNCEPLSFGGSLQPLFGSSTSLSNRFQVGACSRLGFKPKLSLGLEGKTRRGGFPALHAVYKPRTGDANLKSLALRFPRSEFIEQGHFRTICTRVQWAAGGGVGEQCPKGSIYGHIRATTPLLDRPLEGPVYLRSSSHSLPDVVFALKGQVNAEVSVRVDSANGGLRASVEDAPDVPVTKVVLDMQGGKKGLFVNSRDICAHTFSASATLEAQSGKTLQLQSSMQAKCGEKSGRKDKGHGHHRSGKR